MTTDTEMEILPSTLAAHPDRNLVYSSPMIHERRKRILKEARKMLAEGGLEKFSIRQLCKNAEVAQRTLYNAFHNKDRIMALAIREAYEDANLYMRYRTSATTLEGIIDRLISVNSRNLRAVNYTRAVTAIYFSPDTSEDVWQALREMVYLNLRQWLDRLATEGRLHDWVDVEEAAGNFANLEYATINDWAQGRLSDDEYVPRLVKGVLTLAAGITIGEDHDEVLAMLRQIRETGELPEFPKAVYRPPLANAAE